jgi:hypothetical protein
MNHNIKIAVKHGVCSPEEALKLHKLGFKFPDATMWWYTTEHSRDTFLVSHLQKTSAPMWNEEDIPKGSVFMKGRQVESIDTFSLADFDYRFIPAPNADMILKQTPLYVEARLKTKTSERFRELDFGMGAGVAYLEDRLTKRYVVEGRGGNIAIRLANLLINLRENFDTK